MSYQKEVIQLYKNNRKRATMKPKLARFAQAPALACPLCQQSLAMEESSLKCLNRHSYDIAKFGYVNLAPQAKQAKDYDKTNFQNRQVILEAGFYQHILDELQDLLQALPEEQTILDVACGEGYYARKIQEKFPNKEIYAFDLSKDSIQLAAKSDQSLAVKWFVGDLAHLPVQDQSMDVLLDIFSPANYHEFQRVLKKEGLIIKVIPTENHLQEIRAKVADRLRQKDYSNQQVIQHLEEKFQIIHEQDVQALVSLTPKTKEAILKMTPLLFHVHQNKIDWSNLNQVTIAAKVLLAKRRV